MTVELPQLETCFPPVIYDRDVDCGQVRGFFSLELDHDCEHPHAEHSCPPLLQNIPMSHDTQETWCWLCGDELGEEPYSDVIDNDHLGLCDLCVKKLRNDDHATRAAENWNPVQYGALYI